MAGNHLILIKHSSPQVEPNLPPDQWVLSEDGRQRCGPLADRIGKYHPGQVITSNEAKAIETGKLIAEALKIPRRSDNDLGEHDRSNVPHMRSSEFISMVELLFRRPEELVMGRETARAAGERFDAAVQQIIQRDPAMTTAIVSHGTVLALWLADRIGQKPFELWRRLGLPAVVVLSMPDFGLVEMIERIDAR